MSRPPRYLFVCTGNACRSLMAERLLLAAARRRGIAVEARSCGVAAELYFQIPQETRRALATRGISCDGHVPKLVNLNLMAWADAAFAMTRGHLEFLRDRFPQFGAKTFLLSSFCGWGEEDVADPMGGPEEAHEACCRALAAAVEVLLDRASPLPDGRF